MRLPNSRKLIWSPALNENPFSQPDEEPNPFAQPQPTAPEPALNPYAPTAFVSETEGFESDVEGYRRKYLAHEASIKSVGILYLIPGVIFFLLFLIGIAAFLMSMATGSRRTFSLRIGLQTAQFGDA